MNDKTRKIFEVADIDVEDLTAVPGTAIHAYAVSADAWIDGSDVLMFVGETPRAMEKFMYYIGEERNADVVGVGRGISAWQLDAERVEWIRARLTKAVPQ